MESILLTIKHLLGLGVDEECYDLDLIAFINSAILVLTEIGVGPKNGYAITGREETWSSFLGEGLNAKPVAGYIANKVRLMFDPPSSSFALQALKEIVLEQEVRMDWFVEGEVFK
jgi:hypothetical protein